VVGEGFAGEVKTPPFRGRKDHDHGSTDHHAQAGAI
jgi:hypothetical protein